MKRQVGNAKSLRVASQRFQSLVADAMTTHNTRMAFVSRMKLIGAVQEAWTQHTLNMMSALTAFYSDRQSCCWPEREKKEKNEK
jgi:hypothetical protein